MNKDPRHNSNPYNDPRIAAADPALKGVEGGNCNRTACQGPNAVWYNRSNKKFYCRNCALAIQQEENNFAARSLQRAFMLFPTELYDPNDPRHKLTVEN